MAHLNFASCHLFPPSVLFKWVSSLSADATANRNLWKVAGPASKFIDFPDEDFKLSRTHRVVLLTILKR